MSAPASPLETDVLELVRTAFAHARSGNYLALQSLLDRGLPPNVRNEKGDSLLMLASYHRHVSASILLLLRGADPELANGPDGKTPLMFAAMFDRPEMIDLLLSRGADATRTDASGNTALSLACALGAEGALATLERYRRT